MNQADPAETSIWVRALTAGRSVWRSSIGKLPFFGGMAAAIDGQAPADEHHYFLVPLPAAEQGYALYQQRRLPAGAELANDLPIRRFFHLPVHGAEKHLEHLILAGRTAVTVDSDLSQRLHRIADEIDRQSSKVTGGLLLIGGAVAIVNPLLGVGIAAKALFPGLGAIASREGLRYVADRWKQWHQDRAQRIARKQSLAELHATPVVVRINEVLAVLDRGLATTGSEFDPVQTLDPGRVREGQECDEFLLGARAVLAVYDGLNDEQLAANQVAAEDAAFLAVLRRLTGTC